MMNLPASLCYLNGDYLPLRDAKVSVLDRGFIFGDGIYEVAPAYGGCLFRFEHHMARLERSLREVRIPNPLNPSQWRAMADRLLAATSQELACPIQDTQLLVYMQVTRGVALRDHAMPPGISPTVFAMASAMKPPSEEQRMRGVDCVTADDFRWEKAHLKSTSLLGSVFARQISVDADATETIMFRQGMLSEASASNVWVVRDGKVMGPPRDNLVLEGIRYGLIESLCQDASIEFELRRIGRDEVFAADELMLSSATKEILPVRALDGRVIGKGVPGPIYQELYAGYQRAKEKACR